MSDLKSRLDVLHPDLTVPSVRALSYALRHPETWPPYFVWGYHHCNTCAMGLAAALWPEQDRELCARLYVFRLSSASAVEVTAYLLDMPFDAAARIFAELVEDRPDIRRMEDVTPIQVADALDAYLEQKGVHARLEA